MAALHRGGCFHMVGTLNGRTTGGAPYAEG
jgi:hypothetical protein